ncbi:hypothetical protein PAXRUDRAFT_721230 [Paxillus rubicundulus Ve08.2h10]|uniref:Uncharacterized protein n=1 Tax=Paxillus rubicundulus Ve08.2h10 TaxID=930991 RepID=A0A0D0CHX5_9AGAM|nr:hypothetical protein PAXRUDRAFT_721230 [Paxillus rubicundulus Ve08.2h10]
MVCIVCACICDVIQYFFPVKAIPLGNSEETSRTESTFGVDIQAFAFPTTHADGKLTGYSKGVTQLRLPSSKFSE